MLFHSSLRRELARSFGATLLVLLTIVITMLLIHTLRLANRGSVNPEEIMLVLTYTVLARLPTVLTLALFISIVSTLSRMYRESEMVIWFSSGKGLAHFVPPILRFAWPVLLVIVSMTLLVWPWANAQTDELRNRYESRSDLQRVAPGQFQESSSGRRVFFIDKDTADGKEGRNVFIASTDQLGQQTITSARSGRLETIKHTPFLVLNHGQRIEQQGQGDASELKISEFEEYALQIGPSMQQQDKRYNLKSLPTHTLLQTPSVPHWAELGWRIGLGLAAFNFVLLALAVSAGNPRVGKSGNLVFMLLAFMVYYNLLNVGQNWVAAGQVPWWQWMLSLHGGVLCLTLGWLAKRHHNLQWRLWPRRALSTGAHA